jgi:hypothetical protein
VRRLHLCYTEHTLFLQHKAERQALIKGMLAVEIKLLCSITITKDKIRNQDIRQDLEDETLDK